MGRIEQSIAGLAGVAALLFAGCAAAPAAVAPSASALAPATASAKAETSDPKAAAGAKTVRIGDKDGGRTIEARVGDTVELTLSTNPTTGYDWQVDAVDKTLGEPTIARADGSTKAVGAPTTMTFTWKIGAMMADPPDHKVELAYRRPWEKDDPPEQTFKFTLRVAR